MKALAVHVMVDLKGCPFELLDNPDQLRDALRKAAKIAKTTILGESFHKFEPQGVSGVLVVSESHLSVHTWPEFGYAAVDIFSCGDAKAVENARRFVVDALQSRETTVARIDRGMLAHNPSMRLRPIERCVANAALGAPA